MIKSALRKVVNRIPMVRRARLRLHYHRVLKPRLQRQLGRPADHRLESSGPRILVPMLETSHYQYSQILILAKALQLRGAQVKILLCGSVLDGCEIKSVRNTAADPCLTCRFNGQAVLPHFGLDTAGLSDFIDAKSIHEIRALAAVIAADYPASYLYFGMDVVPITNDSVTRYFYGAVPENPDELRVIREKHLVSTMIGAKVAQRVNRDWHPDIVLNNMNVYSGWAPYYRYFEAQGKRCCIVSISPFNYHAVTFNIFDLYASAERFERYRASRQSAHLDARERAELSEMLSTRFSLKTQSFQDMGCFDSGRTVGEFLRIDRTKRNIFLFSNLFWDVGMNDPGGVFSGIIPWVLQTIDLMQHHPDCHLYIKPHPAEKFDGAPSLKGVVEFIRDRFPVLPDNVTLVLPEFKISPYELFPFVDVGVVYNGTIGLEMMLRGVPVVVCGKAPYGGLGLAAEPDSIDSYRQVLTGTMQVPKPDADEVELFAYFYLIKSLIPWHLTDRAYADQFDGYSIETLADVLPGKDRHLDHLCDCVLNPDRTVVEGW